MASINLSEFVVNPYTSISFFDFETFKYAVECGVRTLDKLIDENYYRHPLKEQQYMSYNYRNIGLGCMGYATMLMKLGMRYGSDEAIGFTDVLFNNMFRTAVFASNELAKNNSPFPNYKDCVLDSTIIKNHFDENEIRELKRHGLRNCSLLSIAPTGSIATLIEESGGCEPEFALKWVRKTEGLGGGNAEYHTKYCRAAKEYMQLHNVEEKDLPDYFVVSEDIHWYDRVLTQAVMQNHVDTAISSTINLPFSATKEDVANIYRESWKNGIKGITIFRNGCKKAPILSKETNEKAEDNTQSYTPESELPRGYILDTNDQVVGKKRRLITGCGSLHCTAFFDPITGDLMETYLSKGSTGGCQNFMIGLSRMISLAARSGCDIHSIIDQLNSCGVCPSYAVRRATKHDTSKGSCCPIAVGNALLDMWKEMQDEILQDDIKEDNVLEGINPNPDKSNITPLMAVHKIECPECGEPIVHEGGCDICKNCGYSKCS